MVNLTQIRAQKPYCIHAGDEAPFLSRWIGRGELVFQADLCYTSFDEQEERKERVNRKRATSQDPDVPAGTALGGRGWTSQQTACAPGSGAAFLQCRAF